MLGSVMQGWRGKGMGGRRCADKLVQGSVMQGCLR